jgi:uncharacterized membrane protein YgdD (TMEM256/DUF423 family)
MGAAGVALAAASAHLAHDSGLEAASSMLLFHAPTVLAVTALVDRGLVHGKTGNLAAFGFVVAATLFAGDLSMRHCSADRRHAPHCELDHPCSVHGVHGLAAPHVTLCVKPPIG